jgi:hypothetical protein
VQLWRATMLRVGAVAAVSFASTLKSGRSVRAARSTKLSLASDMSRLLNSPCLSDVSFIVEGKVLYAHRCIVMVRAACMYSLRA